MKTKQIVRLVRSLYPSAKIVRAHTGEVCVSMPENEMTDREMDAMRDNIASALPEWAAVAEEPGALLSIRF